MSSSEEEDAANEKTRPERGERVEFTDDEDRTVPPPTAKKPRRPTPARRIEVASYRTMQAAAEAAAERGPTTVVPLNWSILRDSKDATILRPVDADGVNYLLGGNNPAKKDPENGTLMSCTELVGLVDVASEICELLHEEPSSIVVLCDVWGENYSSFLAHLTQRLFKIKHRGSEVLTSGLRKPKAAFLKSALKSINRAGSEVLVKDALRQHYCEN